MPANWNGASYCGIPRFRRARWFDIQLHNAPPLHHLRPAPAAGVLRHRRRPDLALSWKEIGYPLDYITGRLQENLNAEPLPIALVAHDGAEFLGTASVIASDLEERPQLTPWVAAVWVEPHARSRGVGGALVERAARDCFALGIARAYLCARPALTGFYERLGWIAVERDVGDARPHASLSRTPRHDEVVISSPP